MAKPEGVPEPPKPLPPKPVLASLAEILAAITPENMHPAYDFGPPVGAEQL